MLVLLSLWSCAYEWVMAHMSESCHIWRSRVTYEGPCDQVLLLVLLSLWSCACAFEWIMSHMSEFTYEWVMSHMNQSIHIWMSHVTYEWVMSHMEESCHIWRSLWSQGQQQWCVRVCKKRKRNMTPSYVTRLLHMWCDVLLSLWSRACAYAWVMSDMSEFTYEWVMSHMSESCHIWRSRVIYEGPCDHPHVHMNESCHIWVNSHMNESCHTWVSQVICMLVLLSLWSCAYTFGWVMSHMSEFTYEWVMSHLSEFTYERDMSHMNESCYIWISQSTYEWVMSRMSESCHIWMCVSNVRACVCTGWRRLIGCLKLQVIFRKRGTNHRALLRKMTYEDKTCYDSTPPCIWLAYLCVWSNVRVYVCISSVYLCICIECKCVCGYRVAKTLSMHYLYGSCSVKEPCNWWLFCGKRPAI